MGAPDPIPADTVPAFLDVAALRITQWRRAATAGGGVPAADVAAVGRLATAVAGHLSAGAGGMAHPLSTIQALDNMAEAITRLRAALAGETNRAQAALCLAHAGIDLQHLAAALGAPPMDPGT